jgi:hypothetical protein
MAVTRFVNGLLDPAQQAVHAISMMALARQLGLPEAFVELRHATTHDALPSLAVLKLAAERARLWLWQYYWQPAPTPIQPASIEDKDAIQSQVQDLVKQWRRLRRQRPDQEIKHGAQGSVTRDSLALLKSIGSIKQNQAAAGLWVDCLCTSKNLLHRDSTTALWQPLLERVLQCQPHFRQIMLECGARALGQHIAAPGIPMPPDDPVLPKLKDWMLFLAKQPVNDALEHSAVLKALCLERDEYTASILFELAEVDGYEDVARYAKLRGIQVNTRPREETSETEVILEVTQDGRWNRLAPTDRPLGFLIMP